LMNRLSALNRTMDKNGRCVSVRYEERFCMSTNFCFL
jgi:hypothetical protein